MIYQCSHCGSDFKRTPREAARANRLFCSVPCLRAAKKSDAVYQCDLCGDEVVRQKHRVVPSKNVYCTRECAAIARQSEAS